jgi:hypothetical protein
MGLGLSGVGLLLENCYFLLNESLGLPAQKTLIRLF